MHLPKARTMKQRAKSMMITMMKKDLEERFSDPEAHKLSIWRWPYG